METTGISEEDLQKIRSLRTLVADDLTKYYDTDFNLLRWLQGHNSLSIEEIAKKLRHHLKLRYSIGFEIEENCAGGLRKSTWNVDEMHKAERNHKIHQHWKYGITGPSKVLDNVIVNIEQCGKVDYTGMMESFSIPDVMRARMLDLEQMLAQVMLREQQSGKQAWILYVMDISGLEYNKKLYDLVTGSMRSLAEFMAEHYVEMIKFFVPVCVPNFAYALYTVVRPLLPEKTKDKVRLIAESNWREGILEYADYDSLPSIWNDEKHTFHASVDLPTPFPLTEYYSSKSIKAPENAESITVPAGKAHVVTFFLKEGSSLSWWLQGNRNFGFGCFVSDNEEVDDFYLADQVAPMFPWMPGPTIVPMNDTIIASKDAYYHIWVSNSRSWWFSLCAQLAVDVETNECEVAE